MHKYILQFNKTEPMKYDSANLITEERNESQF